MVVNTWEKFLKKYLVGKEKGCNFALVFHARRGSRCERMGGERAKIETDEKIGIACVFSIGNLELKLSLPKGSEGHKDESKR